MTKALSKAAAKKSLDVEAIENKFSATAFRINQERNDFLLPQVVDFIKVKKWLNLRPEYQRRLVWDDAKRSLFIESLLLNIPIPAVFLYENELSRYEVMDGQQRLNAIFDFYDNGYALKSLVKWQELNGLRYRDLPETLKRGLDRRRLSATVLLVEMTPQSTAKANVRKLVFERLNTGGQHLNAQELRNCLYAGCFNDLLTELAKDEAFTETFDIPSYRTNVDRGGNASTLLRTNHLYRRMLDCQLILRFFAFRDSANIRGSVRAMLDRCMRDSATLSAQQVKQRGVDFRERLSVAREIFGEKTFRFKEGKGWKVSEPLYDGIMVAVDRLWPIKDTLIKNRLAIVKRVNALLENTEAREVIVGRPNTSKAVLKRMSLLESALRG